MKRVKILITYLIMYFIANKNNPIDVHQSKNIILFMFVNASFINLLFIFSKNLNNYSIFCVGIILISLFIYTISKDELIDFKIILFLSYFCIIGICIGYFLYSIIVLIIFYLLNKNYYLLEETNVLKNKNITDVDPEIGKDE